MTTSKFNDPSSPIKIGNTGLPSQVLIPKTIIGGILLPKAYAVSAANLATSALFITEMQRLTTLAKASRAYPLGPFTDTAEKSEEDVYVKSNYGVSTFVREGKVMLNFAMTAGGIGLQNALRSFNQTKAHTILLYDSENTVLGTKDGAGGMKGFEIEEFMAKAWKVSDGTKPAVFAIDIMFANTRELNDDIVFIKLDTGFHGNVKGILDLVIEKVSSTGSKAVVKVMTKLSKTNLYSFYKTELAAPAVWAADNAGVTAAISAVTGTDATETFELTLTVASTTHLSLVSAALLEAAGIGGSPDNGYESNTIDITTGAEVD